MPRSRMRQDCSRRRCSVSVDVTAMIRALGIIAMGIAIPISIWVGVIYRYSHPELTETQLFLANWPLKGCVMVLVLVAMFALHANTKRKYRR